jgi:Rrf2 family protein
MKISKKCQYALRAVFELAWRNTDEPVKIHSIARSQGISPRFTEVILNDLKHAGFVDSKRGKEGGYMLAKEANVLTVGEVIEHIQGPIAFVPDAARSASEAVFLGGHTFSELWQEINKAVSEVCFTKTFADLVKFEETKRERCVPNYSI